MHADRDLTVADLAQGARVLAGHARRGGPVLDEPGVVDHPRIRIDQRARLAGQRLTDRLHVPRRTGHELLQPLVIHPQPRRHRLHRLAPAVEHQPPHIQPRRRPPILPRQRREHLADKGIQLLIDTYETGCIHPPILSVATPKTVATHRPNKVLLETRWETKLAALAEAEQALEAARHTLAPLPGRSELEKLAADLPGLWHASTTSHKDRKRLLRTVIADITLLPEPDQHKARIGIRWHTGATDEIAVARAAHSGTAKRSPSPAVAMVIRLGPTTPTAELADQLNAAGLTTGTGAPFDVKAVQWIRHAYHVPAPNPYADGEISVAEAAARLGTSTGVVYDWIKTGKLDARRGPGSRLCIAWTDRVETECRTRMTESGHLNPAARRTTPRKRA